MRKALYILADLDDTDVRWLVDNGRRRFVGAGETLIAEGRADRHALYRHRRRACGRDRAGMRVAKLATGDIVGEMSLIEKRPPVGFSSPPSAKRKSSACHKRRSVPACKTDIAFAARFYRALAVFLSDRLAHNRLAPWLRQRQRRDRAAFRSDELDEGALDTLHVAGDRMRRMLVLLGGTE